MGIEIPDSLKTRAINGATIYTPNGNSVNVDFNGPAGWVIERKMLDKYLAKLAAKAGAKIIVKTNVYDVKKGDNCMIVKMKHRGETFEIKAKVLVACDGVESRIARMVGINTTLKLEDICSCAQFEMTGIEIDSRMLELYIGNEIAPGGYIWIFPKGPDSANVGIGIRKPFAKKSALTYLEKFIKTNEKLKNGSIIEANAGGVPVGGFLETMVDDNFIIAGDAARQVNPIHGGGISEGFVSGMLVAKIIAKAKEKNDFSKKVLSEYDKKWNDGRGKKLKKVLKLRHLEERLTDQEMNWLSEYIKGEEIINLAKASGFKKLAFLLMKKPRLIGIARKLM